MKIDLEPGVYVVAVSGGVDSMVLLDLLIEQGNSSQLTAHSSMSRWRFIVAHYDHGIRPDSQLDRELVQKTAERYRLPFVYDEGNLGPKASEATARKARYNFLQRVQASAGAQAIITAHHQDDLIETAILNLLRGTDRKGLSALKSTKQLIRPLLDVSKKELLAYAKTHKLKWREDPTNTDTRYLRNHIRANVVPKLTIKQRQSFINLLAKSRANNTRLDLEIANFLQSQGGSQALDRQAFIDLPHAVAREVMAGWLRQHGIREFDKKSLERLVRAAKTYTPGKQADIDASHKLEIGRQQLKLRRR